MFVDIPPSTQHTHLQIIPLLISNRMILYFFFFFFQISFPVDWWQGSIYTSLECDLNYKGFQKMCFFSLCLKFPFKDNDPSKTFEAEIKHKRGLVRTRRCSWPNHNNAISTPNNQVQAS